MNTVASPKGNKGGRFPAMATVDEVLYNRQVFAYVLAPICLVLHKSALLSAQLYVLGHEAQRRLAGCDVLLVGLHGVGIETGALLRRIPCYYRSLPRLCLCLSEKPCPDGRTVDYIVG
jgi:hypothetical protein